MNLAEKWQQEGMQKGIHEGIQKGIQKGKQEAAKQMLVRGMSPQVIQEVTGLTAQEIEYLKNEPDSE